MTENCDLKRLESPKGGGVDWDGADGKGDCDRSYGQPQLAHGDNSGQVEDKPDQKSISLEEKTAATYEPSRRSMTSVGAKYDDSRRRMDDRSSRERGTPELFFYFIRHPVSSILTSCLAGAVQRAVTS